MQKAINRQTKAIGSMYKTIQMYRGMIKRDEDAGKLKHVFSHVPLRRVNELIHQFHLLKANNAHLKAQRKALLN